MIFCSKKKQKKMYLSCKFEYFFGWCKMESHIASGLIHMKISTRGKLIERIDIENKSQYNGIQDTVVMGRLIKNAKKTKQITWLFYEDSPQNQTILVANHGIFALPFPWYPLILFQLNPILDLFRSLDNDSNVLNYSFAVILCEHLRTSMMFQMEKERHSKGTNNRIKSNQIWCISNNAWKQAEMQYCTFLAANFEYNCED